MGNGVGCFSKDITTETLPSSFWDFKLHDLPLKLKMQSFLLVGLQLVGRLCSAKLSGDKVESMVVNFKPNNIKPGEYEADTKTAG